MDEQDTPTIAPVAPIDFATGATPVGRGPLRSHSTLPPPVKDRLSAVHYLNQCRESRPEDPASRPTDPSWPETVAAGFKYRLDVPLGVGGMGQVHLAEDVDIGRHVAMKTMLPAHAGEPALVQRFIQEAQVIGRLDHPNIVPIHDLGINSSGYPYFTMKLVRGQTLSQIIGELRAGNAEAHRTYSFTRRLQLMLQVCAAVSFAHAQRIIHRDIKPENIMLGEFGEVLVMDWGLAKTIGQVEPTRKRITQKLPVLTVPPRPDGSTALTGDGDVLGTPIYMAPEQAQGLVNDLDERCDVYAIGAVMYTLFALERPGGNAASSESGRALVARNVVGPDSIRCAGQGRVPREIANIIMQAIATDRDRRYPSVPAMAADIQACVEGRVPVACPVTALKRAVFALGGLVDQHGAKIVISCIVLLVAAVLRATGQI